MCLIKCKAERERERERERRRRRKGRRRRSLLNTEHELQDGSYIEHRRTYSGLCGLILKVGCFGHWLSKQEFFPLVTFRLGGKRRISQYHVSDPGVAQQ
jgi:hypothetical protein